MDTINELHDAMLKGQAKSLTEPLLRNLIAYTRDHFTAEEAIMLPQTTRDWKNTAQGIAI